MSIADYYHLIGLFAGIGYLQNACGHLIAVRRYPVLASRLGITEIFYEKAAWLKYLLDSPGIVIILIGKIVLSLAFVVGIQFEEAWWALPLLMILVDQLGVLRFRLLGKSDSALLYPVLTTLSIHSFFQNPWISKAGLVFISVLLCLAYLAAGFHKLNDKNWKNGRALIFYSQRFFRFKPASVFLSSQSKVTMSLGWTVIIFESGFILGLIHPNVALCLIGIGFIFHLSIAITSGINFFFWTFTGCYPAFFFTTTLIHQYWFPV